MITKLSGLPLTNATGLEAVRISASQIVASSQVGSPSVSVALDALSWDGDAFSVLGSYIGVPYATVPGSCHILWHANRVWTIGLSFGIGGPAGVLAFAWDGAVFTQMAGRVFHEGGTLTVGYPTRMVTDSTFVYLCQQQSKVIGNSGPPMWQPIYAAKNYLVALAYAEPNQTVSGILEIPSFNTPDIVAQGGAVFYRYNAYLRKMIFNGSAFSQDALLNDANLHNTAIMGGDGTYIYAKHADDTSLLVYNNSLGIVTTFDTGKVITNIACVAGSVYTTFADETREYLFDGTTFTLVDNIMLKIVSPLV